MFGSMLKASTLLFIACLAAPARAQAPDRRSCHARRVPTPLSRDALMATLEEAYVNTFGEHPSKERLLVGWSHVAFENGGGATIVNNNFGNVGPRPWETDCYYNASDNHFYRSYLTPLDGALRYWAVIGRCRPAFDAFGAGRVGAAMAALKRCNYFEMDLDAYAHRVQVIYSYITRKVKREEELERERRQRELEDAELDERPEQSSVGRCDQQLSR